MRWPPSTLHLVVCVVVFVLMVVVVMVNFVTFRLHLSNNCTDLIPILCGHSLNRPILSCTNQEAIHIHYGIMVHFVQF